MTIKISLIILLFLLFLPIKSQSSEDIDSKSELIDNGIITEIIIKNNHSIGDNEILDMMGIRIGDRLDYDIITKGIKSAFLKGLFTDIKVSVVPGDSKTGRDEVVNGKRPVLLLIEVFEREYVDSITIEGNVLLKQSTIRELFDIKDGMVFYEYAVYNAVDKLINQIEKLGFADVQVYSQIMKYNGLVKVRLTIKENIPFIINQIVVSKDEALIKKILNISIGDIYNEKEINEKIQSVVDKYKENGHYRFHLTYKYEQETGQLTFTVDEGEKLVIDYVGNKYFSKSELTQELPFFDIESVNALVIDESIETLNKLYHKNGFSNVVIQYNVNVRNEDVPSEQPQAVIHLVYNIKEGIRYNISNIIIKGSSIDETKIKDALTLKEGDPLNTDSIEDDKANLIGLFNLLGFTDMEIESFDVRYIEDSKKAEITISINEGKYLTIESISIQGNIAVPSKELLSSIAIKTGSKYNKTITMNAKHIISSQYVRLGFSDVIVTHSMVTTKDGSQLNFVITEGNKYIFGNTIVKGNNMTRYSVFKSVFKHKRGDPYDYNVLLGETLMLNRTRLFKTVNIIIIERQDNIKDIVFEVDESNRWILESGFGYAEYEGVRGFMDIGFRNMFGGNRQIRVRAEASEISQMYAINYLEPWFLPPVSLKALISYTQKHNKSINSGENLFSLNKYTATTGIESPINNIVRLTLYYELSQVETYNVQPDIILSRDDTGTLLISSLVPSISFDSRDNPFDPRKGILSSLTFKIASNIIFSETDFVKITGYFNEYISILDYLTLALSIRSGVANGIRQIDVLPIVERFFLGGMNTIRGFKRDDVGPKGLKGTPTGGNFFGLGNVETRLDFGSGFGAVIFFDIGDVWLNLSDINTDNLRKSAGLGFRYMTPVGPFRLDYGHKLDRRKDESMGEFHFSLGHTF